MADTDTTLAPTVDSTTPAPDAPPAVTDYQAYKASRVAPAPEPEAVAPAPVPVEAVAPPPETTEPEPEPEPDEHPDEPAKAGDTRTPTQKRIDKAVRAQREAERREVAAREKAARLEGELSAIRSGQAKPAPVDAPSQTVATTAAMPENPADPKPVIDSFDSYEAGIEALAAWKARQEYRALRAQERLADEQTAQRRQHEDTVKGYGSKVSEFKASHADWDAVVNQDLPITPDIMAPYIVQSPIGPALTYYLGQHPDECRALAAMSGPAAFAALGKLEAKVEGQHAPVVANTPAPVVPHKPTSQAPAPITPVAGSRVAAPTLNTHVYADYKRARLAGKL